MASLATTHLNEDFSLRAVSQNADATWGPSPGPGIERRVLDGIGGVTARATSVLRYAPGTKLDQHVNRGGEEFIVLDGVYSDERGDFPAGTYVRNPPGSKHVPFTREGCTIFVKHWQFAAGDKEEIRINTKATPWLPGLVPGLSVMPLHGHRGIDTALVRWAPNTRFNSHVHPGGEEIFVLKGVFRDEHGNYPEGTWFRNPQWSRHTPFTEGEGAVIYVKTGGVGATYLAPST